jgi:proteasome assembly chaperone (PAC2) family protein
VLELTERVGGGPLFTLGGTYDRVSHRMAATISAWAPTPELRHTLTSLGVRFSNYEGPSSIQSALIDCCVERRIAAASLWGHVPHYVSGTPNPKVVQALLQHLSALLGLQVDLGPLDVAARELDEQIEQALQGREDVQAYVSQIEAHAADEWQAIVPWEGTPGPLQSAESIIEELDTFLRELREDDEGATE